MLTKPKKFGFGIYFYLSKNYKIALAKQAVI